MIRKNRILSLFSGIGGIDAGFDEVGGFETVQFVEFNEKLWPVLSRHWPGVPIHGPIETFDGRPLRGVADIVAGGPPCQPSSTAGKRLGSKDSRWLWPEFCRVVEEVRPRWFLAENPTGFLSMPESATPIRRLERAGYEVGAFVFEAAHVGAGHPRARTWFVGKRTEPDDVCEQSERRRGRGYLAGSARAAAAGEEERKRLRDAGGDCRQDSRAKTVANPDDGRCRQGVVPTELRTNGGVELPRPSRLLSAAAEGPEVAGKVGRFAASLWEQQHEWEPARLVGNKLNPDLFDAYMGFPVGWTAGLSWKERITALGNTAVPQCVIPFAAAILADDAEQEDFDA